MGFDNLRAQMDAGLEGLRSNLASPNSVSPAVSLGVGAAVGGLVGAGAVAIAKRRKKKSSAKRSRKKTSRSRSRKRRSSRRTPRTAGKGKDRSTKRIRYTKKGQPYVIGSNGKARFIKKSSAKQSRKRKGGRY